MIIKKLGLNINFFDGGEHLEPILKLIRNYIDVVIVMYQKNSYFGNPILDEDYNEMNRLKNNGWIDEIIEFSGDIKKDARHQETDKRNIGNNILRDKYKCSHILNIDSDEYYLPNDFKNTIDYINDNKFQYTYCRYINYYHDFGHYIVYPFKNYVPFICNSNIVFTYNAVNPCATDPSRRIGNNPFYISTEILSEKIILMHHASWIRKNLRNKLNNWSAKKYIPNFDIDSYVTDYDNFNDDKEVRISLNVPNNKVMIERIKNKFETLLL